MKMKTPEQVAAIFGCTPEQASAQFSKNAAQLSDMAARAAQSGGKVNQYTTAQLRVRADACAKAAA